MSLKEILIAFPGKGIVKVAFLMNIETKKTNVNILHSDFHLNLPDNFNLYEIKGDWQFYNENDKLICNVADLIETDLNIENQILLTTYKVIDKNLNEEDNVEGTFIRL